MRSHAANVARWWGGQGRSDNRLTILDLVRNDTLDVTLDVTLASLVWLLVEKKASIIVAAGPQLAGKTTLLTAALDFAPPWYEQVYTRGREEDFSFLEETDPSNTYILVPELSDHTPAYLWGDRARTLFQVLNKGYSVAATIHADTPEEVIGMLDGYPLYIPHDLLSNLDAVVNLRLVYGERDILRRVSLLSLQTVGPLDVRGPPRFLPMVRWDSNRDIFTHNSSTQARHALASRLGMTRGEMEDELARLAETLDSWLKGGLTSESELRQVVERYYEEHRQTIADVQLDFQSKVPPIARMRG